MYERREPIAKPPRESGRLGSLSTRLFVELSDGRVVRRPTTMLRPPTWREAMLHRPATTADIVGMETIMKDAVELKALRERFYHDDGSDDGQIDIDL